MTTYPFALIWGPMVVGFTVAAASYGATIGQLIYYVQGFPRDKRFVKILVFITFIIDSAHTFQSSSTVYSLLIRCRRNNSPTCVVYLPWGAVLGTFIMYWITFMVQLFYAHRVWIISSHNRVITFIVVASATAQVVLGLMVVADAIRIPTMEALTSSRYTPWAAIASATCDAMITSSVFYHLRPARTGVTRRGNVIKRINDVFIQMGLLSFINSMAMVILYYIQDHQLGEFMTAAPGLMLSKTYVNSMLAVLNARKSIRDQEYPTVIDVPTIPTIY